MEGLVSFLDLPARSDSLPRSRKNIYEVDTPASPVDCDALPTVPTDYQPHAELASFKQDTTKLQDPVGTVNSDVLSTIYDAAITTVDSDHESLLTSATLLSSNEFMPREQRGSLPTVPSGPLLTVDSGSKHSVKNRHDNDGVNSDGPSVNQHRPLYPLSTVGRGFGERSPQLTTRDQSGRKWITEDGQIVSEKQVRPFRLAQDALNSNERALYSVLWNSREARADPKDPNIKIVRAGYETLAKQTNMAKKTIQRLIPRLLSKNFIEISENPNFLNRTAAAYRVLAFKKVLDICAEQGRAHVAKLGHGVAFAKPCQSVPSGPPTTVGGQATATVNRESPVDRDGGPVSTMDKRPTFLESSDSKEESNNPQFTARHNVSSSLTPSSSRNDPPSTLLQGLRALLNAYNVELDSEATTRLWNECRSRMPDCTANEVLHFSKAKAGLFSSGKITSPVGFLLFAVPKCFEGPSFDEFRLEQERARRIEEEHEKRAAREMEDVQRQLQEMLNSPTSTEEDRRFALRLLSER